MKKKENKYTFRVTTESKGFKDYKVPNESFQCCVVVGVEVNEWCD